MTVGRLDRFIYICFVSVPVWESSMGGGAPFIHLSPIDYFVLTGAAEIQERLRKGRDF